MKKSLALIVLVLFSVISCGESDINPFWADGEEFFDVQKIFEDERFPNLVIAKIVRFNLNWLTEGRDWREFLPE